MEDKHCVAGIGVQYTDDICVPSLSLHCSCRRQSPPSAAGAEEDEEEGENAPTVDGAGT